MTWEKLFIALLPVPAFYFIYYRYFTFIPEYGKHLEALLSGVAYAFVILLISPYIDPLLPLTNPIAAGFIKAALIEKIGAFAILLIIHMYYPNFSVMEAVISSMIFGIGFSAVENIGYAMSFGYNIIILRILYSVPLHMTTCGIMGYYLGLRRMSSTISYRTIYSIKGLIFAVILHGIFDSVLLLGGYMSFATSPFLILLVIILEVLLARSQTMIPSSICWALQLRFEDWLSIERQPKFDRWILQSMGMPNTVSEPFFQWRPGLLRFFFVIMSMIAAMAGLAFRDEATSSLGVNLRPEEQLILLGIFPFSIGIILILVGAINPDFFKNSKISIPIISDVEVKRQGAFEEILVTYDITAANCFLKTAEPLGLGTKKEVRFVFPHFSSQDITGTVIWENHSNPHTPLGTIVRLDNIPIAFILKFYARYSLFKLRKGIIFNLRLPGFESIRKLFMRPISTMQDVRVFEAGKIIYSEGESGKEFYLLKKGSVIFYKTKENGEIITIDTIEGEQIFGEMAIIGNIMRDSTARCVTDCVVAIGDRENLKALIRHNTDVAISLLETLAHRLQLSEKVLFENITKLEKDFTAYSDFSHSGLALIFMGLGGYLKNGILKIKIDTDRIKRTLKEIDQKKIQNFIDAYICLIEKDINIKEVMDQKITETAKKIRERIKISITDKNT
jgi:CRP-like cAMP-binding protein/RsiW-degrading membrane proteinase PrsW (M82 family)